MFILVNLKTYNQGAGKFAVEIAEKCLKVSRETGVDIALAPQAPDIYRVSSKTDAEVWAQHIDAVEPGSNTGHIQARAISKAGAKGTLLNHSEKRITFAEASESIGLASEQGLKTVLCSNNVETTAAASQLDPDFVAFEPPELIGSGKPVSKVSPEEIKEAVEKSKTPILCGAGISTGMDVKSALDLGTKGVLVASAVVKSGNPEKVLRNLVDF